MDTESYLVYIKTKGIQSDIAKNVETRFDTSIYELDRLLLTGKNKKVIALMKNLLGREINMLHKKTYLTDNNNEYNKSKSTKKVSRKKKT